MLKKITLILLVFLLFLMGTSSFSIYANDFLELVKDASPEEVKYAIEAGANVNKNDNAGNTALHYVSDYDSNIRIVEILADSGADVNAKNSVGVTALMQAARFNNIEIVEILLDKGADVNVKSEFGFTALMYAADNYNKEIVKILVDRGADVNAKNENGYTALTFAVHGPFNPEDVEAIIEILLDNGLNIHDENNLGNHALIVAAQSNDTPEIIENLIDRGVDVSFRDIHGYTALMRAAFSNPSPIIIETLIDRGADVNARNEAGETALMKVASSYKYFKVYERTKILIEAGADVNARDEKGRTALMYATEHRYLEVIQELLDNGAEVNAKDENGKTALMIAANNRNYKIIEELLNRGADVHAIDKEGKTALMIAVNNHNLEAVKILLDEGADFTSNMFVSAIESIKPSMSFAIKKDIIEIYANLHGWQEAKSKVIDNYISFYEDDTKRVWGTLWSPSLTWVDIMYEADLYFEDRKEAQDRYENFKQSLINKDKIILTLNVVALEKEEVLLDNLTFILEKNDEYMIRDESNIDISSRGIEEFSASGTTAYSHVVDLVFSHEEINILYIEQLKLYVIFDNLRERLELNWNLYSDEKALQELLLESNLNSDKKELLSNLIERTIFPLHPGRHAGESKIGAVIMEATIDSDGTLKETNILKSSGISGMNRNAQSTVERGWSFNPYESPYTIIIQIVFYYDHRFEDREYPFVNIEFIDLIIEE